MPKANDPLCPLGFHPQTRWPNRCKRCFRDYNDHQHVRNQSGSNTSLNSLSSYDSNTNTFIRRQDDEGSKEPSSGYGSRDSLVSSSRVKDEFEGYKRSRSDMSAELLARVNDDAYSSSSSPSKDRGDDKGSSSSKLTSWNKSRPTSWSAQDLRAAVDEAKEQIRSSREDLHRLYGSTKSLTAHDLGSLGDLTGSSSDLSKDGTPYSSFSSYLAMRTKSPARPPLARASSLQGTTSTSSTARREEEEVKKVKEEVEQPIKSKLSTETKPRSILTSSISDKTSTTSKSSLSSITEGKKSSLSSSSGDAKPPKPPSRLRTTVPKLGDISETPKEEKPKKNILSLRGDHFNSSNEVKSEDDSVDASYVIQLAKPKKEPKRVEIDLQSEVDRLSKELKEKNREVTELEERVTTLERDKKDLSSKRSMFGGDVRKHTEVNRMQQKVDDLNDDVKTKNKEIKELKKEIEKRPLPKDVEKTMEDLRSKLQAAEQLCEELMDENEEYKKEVRALEDEVEEMQDNFREEQADEYRDLKRELEQTAKNCRVLQFKLKKAERRSDLMEKDKSEIEDKLKELQVGESDVQKAEKIKSLEKEVNLAKDVSVKMHDEMEKMKKQLEQAEKEKLTLAEKCKDQPVKPGGKYSRSQMMGRQGSQDNTDQLMRDLQDAGEREQDLKDQLKFAEEETKNLRKKLSRVEEENETLALQLKKMSNKAKADRQRSLERSGSLERASSVERGQLSRQGSTEKPPVKEPDEGITEDLDPTELKIQLELNEQESAVLRRKVEDLESENERLQREIKGVLSSADMRPKKGEGGESDSLRTKVTEMEQENERLLDENKRLQFKAMKRLPLSGSESSYIERQVMEDKVKRLEKKLKDTNEKLKNAQMNASSSSIASNNIDGKTKGSSDIGLESLRSDVTKKEGEITNLKSKLKELQEKCDKVTKECDDMKNSSAYKERTPKKPKDLTPKSTLIKWVDELESECATLNVKLKFLETEKQVLEEMSKGKRDSNNAIDGEMCHLLFAEREDLKTENKALKDKADTKESEARLQKRKVRDLEMEKNKLMEQIKAYKEKEGKIRDTREAEEQRSKLSKISEFTPKSVLKQMVNDLNDECARLHVALADADKAKKGRPASEDLTNLRDLEDKLERERERNDELARQLREEREKLDKPLATRKKTGGQDDEIRRLEDRIDTLKKDLAKEKEKNEEAKSKSSSAASIGFEEHRAAQTEKHKLQKELSSAQQTSDILEKKLKEAEENLKQSERAERKAKMALEKLELRLDEEKGSVSQAEERQKELTTSWLKEREDMKNELTEYKKGKEKAERELRLVKKARDSLESKFEDEKRRADDADSKKKKDGDEVRALKGENTDLNNEIDELRDKILKLEKTQGTSDAKQKKELEGLRLEKQGLEIRMATLESELKTEQKKRERLEKDKEKTSSLLKYKDNAEKAEGSLQKVKKELETMKMDYQDKIETLEKKNAVDKQELEDLHNKYELLEEEFVVQKAQYTMAMENREYTTSKESNNKDYSTLKKEHDTIEIELKTLRETYNLRQDTWIKEKLDMQEQLKNLEDRLNKVSLDPASYSEKKRLKDIIDDKNQQLEKYRRDEEAIKDQVAYYRRESEELRRKLEDLEKLQEISDRKESSRPSKDTSSFDTTIRELRSKLSAAEKNNKTEHTKLKMKYDSKIKAMTEEVSTLTQHMSKYRRERDTYKEMLDGAQRSLADMKGTSGFRTSRADAANEAQQNLQEKQELQSLVTEFEDKLADAKIENAKLKNDVIDQKTNFEIQLCDLQTKLNEYEEDRLLGGGSRRVPGLRTRLELNWQKEREEQQRLIQETATLAKDLRQTLYEVERERDLERLEAKRKIDQLKKTVGQETSDTKSKVQELQHDLQELREAHAKLRQINEKLRRDKDRTEVEREAMRDKFLGTSREHLNQQTKMEKLTDEMKMVKDLAPLVLGEGIDGRDGSLSRLPGDPKPRTKEEFTDALKKACKTMDEMKRMYNLFDDKDRLKRAPSFRRALSDLDTDDEGPPLRPRSAQRGGLKSLSRGQKSNLYRKTQSLDHQMAEERGKIWVSTDAGSTTSIESSMTDDMRRAKYDRDISLDRISTGSQTSDLDSVAGDKKKKGLKGVMSKFGKSKSIEESGTGTSIVGAGLKAMGVGVGGSGNDIPSDVEKDSVKGKLKGLFKKGPPSRSQSVDRATDGVSVRNTASTYEYDTASMASNTSLESNTSASLPPVMRRLRGRNNFGAMTKAQSFTAIGRQSSVETDV